MRLDESLLIGADTVTTKIKSNLTSHIGRAIAVLATVVCAVFTFAEIAFVDISLGNFTVDALVICSLAVIMYLSLESEGETLGKSQEEYQKAKKEADTLSQEVKGDDIIALREYLLSIYEGELKAREDRLLLAYGLSREELLRYREGERFGNKKSRQLRRVAKTTSRAITPNELLFFEGSCQEEISSAPNRRGRMLGLARILPSILCTLLTVAVMIDFKEGFTLRLMLEGVLKLSALLSMGLRGYLAGIHYVNEVLTPYHKLREKLLDAFLRKRG